MDWSYRGDARPERVGDEEAAGKSEESAPGKGGASILAPSDAEGGGASAPLLALAEADPQAAAPPPSTRPKLQEQGFWHKLRAALRMTARFPWAYWALGLYCILAWTSVASFNNVAADYILRHIDPEHAEDPPTASSRQAGFILSIVFIATASVAPFAGALITAAGVSTPFMLASGAVVVVLHLFLAGVPALAGLVPLKALFAVLGLAFAVYAAAFWPLVPRVAASGRGGFAALCGMSDEEEEEEGRAGGGSSIQIAGSDGTASPRPQEKSRKGPTPAARGVSADEVAGSAFGTMGALQNIGLTIVPQIVGQLQPTKPTPEGHPHLGGCSRTYQCVCLFLAGMAAAGLVLGVYMLLWELGDVRKAGGGEEKKGGGKDSRLSKPAGGMLGEEGEGARRVLLGGADGRPAGQVALRE